MIPLFRIPSQTTYCLFWLMFNLFQVEVRSLWLVFLAKRVSRCTKRGRNSPLKWHQNIFQIRKVQKMFYLHCLVEL